MATEKKNYSTTWEKIKVLSLGGKWAYAVGIIKDNNGIRKVRITKGKLAHPFPKSPDWKEINLKEDVNPISQVQKMNFKSLVEFTATTEIVKEMFQELNGGTT
ncbi:MAG: hypothetical protein ACFFD2_01395 [Promethearchaeota archaeon]